MTAPTLPPAPAASLLAPAYDRAFQVFPSLHVTAGEPREDGGWVRASGLARGGEALEVFLARDEEQTLRDHGQRGRPDVVASFGLHRYAWPAALLFTLPWFLLRRVPHAGAEDVSLHRGKGRMTVRCTSFSCLPEDPAAGHPAARPVADEEELRAAVREAFAAHLGPVLEGFRPRLRRGRRALWGMATDELTEGLWYLGHLLGESERAVAEAERLLPGGTPPFHGGASFRELPGPGGGALLTRDRASCCLFYTLRPEDACVTCPRTRDAERVARLSGAR